MLERVSDSLHEHALASKSVKHLSQAQHVLPKHLGKLRGGLAIELLYGIDIGDALRDDIVRRVFSYEMAEYCTV